MFRNDGDLAIETSIIAFGEPNAAHAAMANH
jgi:hypothetical protein